MSNIDIVFGFTKKIETYLEKEFKAEGRGLHTKVSSVDYRLPVALIKKIRWIATIRNNMAHTEGFELKDIEDFKATCEAVLAELETLSKEGLRLIGQESSPSKPPMDNSDSGINKQFPFPLGTTAASLEKNMASKVNVSSRANLESTKRDTYKNSYSNTSIASNSRWSRFFIIFLLICGFLGIVKFKLFTPAWNSSSSEVANNNISPIINDSGFGDVEAINKNYGNSDLIQAYLDIDKGVFGYISKNTKIWLDSQQLSKNEDGTYDVSVMLNWDITDQALLGTLNKYFYDESGKNIVADMVDIGMDHEGKFYGIIIPGSSNNLSQNRTLISASVYKYLTSKQVIIKVSIGKKWSPVTIASGRQCSVTCDGIGDSQYQIQPSNRKNPQNIMFGFGQREQNPVVIKGITMDEFKSVKMITTSIEIKSN